MTKLRGAIVGCGMIAQYHLRGWVRIPEVEIVSLCDPDRSRAEKLQSEYAPAAQLYESIDAAIFADKLDFVDIL